MVASYAALRDLLDDDPSSFTLGDWRERNAAFYRVLADRGLVDPKVVSFEAHEFLNNQLIRHRVGAASDTQNAGHVRAQNENIVHYALAMGASAVDVSISLQAGFIHDLNKAFGEPLRSDRFAPCDQRGRPIRAMTTMAQIVGLNHLGERTRRLIQRATRLDAGPLSLEVAEAVDRCIVHHGLGSSQFIRDLVDGDNPWWGHEFVDPQTGIRRLLHPQPPPMTMATVLHDLADSTQQMQGGAAWLMKYPSGYWRASRRPYASMLSDRVAADLREPTGQAGSSGSMAASTRGIAMSLAMQIEEETRTCRGIIAEARALDIVTVEQGEVLNRAVDAAAQPSIEWVSDDPGQLEEPEGRTAYHDVGRALGIGALEAQQRLQQTESGTPEGDRIEDALWASARRLDLQRVETLATAILA